MAAASKAAGARPPLTDEAEDVLAAADRGGVPMFTSTNLARIAQENGIVVSPEMSPNDIIDELRKRKFRAPD